MNREMTNAEIIASLPVIPDLDAVNMELAGRKLEDFIKLMWKYAENKKFVSGWHIGYICEHLEAVTRGEIKRLLINMPPRHMKSLGVSVFWPAWEWLQNPKTQWLFASYAHTLSIRDNVKCRRVVLSPRYQQLVDRFQPGLALVDDQNTKIKFENTEMGYRLATSVDGQLTGDGGDKIVIDDPHNVREAESDAVRIGTLEWWDEAMQSRLNDPNAGAFVVIMQRVHEDDLSGHILENDDNDEWVHLCMPARYEADVGNRIKSWVKGANIDPRKKEGDPLWPERYTDKNLRDLEKSLGEYGSAGQLQQRPAPRGGGMFEYEKMQEVDTCPSKIVDVVRYWDKAGTEKKRAKGYDPCETAGVKMAKLQNGQFIVLDYVHGMWGATRREKKIKMVAENDGKRVKVYVEQEPGSGGKESAESTIRNLAGFLVEADRPTDSKALRAEPMSCQVNGGNVLVLRRKWTKQYKRAFQNFPAGKKKDAVDASTGAFNKLSAVKKAGAWGRKHR